MEKDRVIVVGAGVAGCEAALEAAKLGLKVTLIDEHPQNSQAMSLDAPYFYGARLPGILDDAAAIAERVLGANDGLMACLEADVEILTGSCVWGSFRPGPNNILQRIGQIGIADGDRSQILDAPNLILAAGSRDLVLSFQGWELPGVLGANGADALMSRYQALSGRKMAILGSSNVALRLARRAIEGGIDIAAIVEAAPAILGDPTLAEELAKAGVPILTGCVVERALGEHDLRGLRLKPTDGGGESEIECDLACMAFGIVPNVELAAVSGAALHFDAARGGWVPSLDADFQSSAEGLYVVGDAAGIDEAMILDPAIAAEQGRHAARAIARKAGLNAQAAMGAPRVASGGIALQGARSWHRALVKAGGMDVTVCQCESVTRRELLELSPPKYLGAGNARASGGVARLSPAARNSQDLVKRLTRAGMGHCQGKRCRDQVAMLLADASGLEWGAIEPGSYRPPVRPVPLGAIWAHEESEETRRTWPIWLHPVEEGAPGFAAAPSEAQSKPASDHEKS